MVRSNWESATGEVRVLMDAQTAHELVKLLQREDTRTFLGGLGRELLALREAVARTLHTPGEGKRNA